MNFYWQFLALVAVTAGLNICGVIKRTPAFDALIQQIALSKPLIKPVLNTKPVVAHDYPKAQAVLNKVSVIYFLIRLATYERIGRSVNFYTPKKSLQGWVSNYFSRSWVYKVSIVGIETLLLKTIIKLAIYVGMHDALDFIADASKRALMIVMSTLFIF